MIIFKLSTRRKFQTSQEILLWRTISGSAGETTASDAEGWLVFRYPDADHEHNRALPIIAELHT